MSYLINQLFKYQLAFGLLTLNIILLIIYTPTHYYFEMFQSFAFQILLVIAFFFLIFLFNKKWVGTLSTGLAIAILLFHIPIFSMPSTTKANAKIAHFNVLKFNCNYEQTITAALASDADFISFNEVSPGWGMALKKGLSEKYPNQFILPLENSYGIAIFSKTAINNLEIHYWASEFNPSLTGNTFIAGTNVSFVAAHTIPPLTKTNFSQRNKHLQYINTYLKQVKGPKILVGDLNAVSWCQAILTLVEENQLEDSRKSWQPTYPAWFELAAIPIDHIFYSSELACTKFYTVKSTSSDHYGIVGEYIIHQQLGYN